MLGGAARPGIAARPLPAPETADPQRAPAGTGVALLVPLTGPNAGLGQSLVNAAKLALAAPGSPVLEVRDTQGTPQGAADAAGAAIAAGAGIIIGPLTTAETAAASVPARAAGVPMLAFTSDATQAQPGVWVMGITPAQQIRRALSSAMAQGKSRAAAVLPDTDFGHAMATALTVSAAAANLPAPDIRFHSGQITELNAMMRDVSGYASRRGPIDAQIRLARAARDADGRRKAAELVKTPIPPPPLDILVLADTGEKLATLASLLPYYDLDPPAVQVVGPALWAAPQTRSDAPLRGAWYAAPDPSLRTGFNADYTAAYGSAAPGLADFAYDAATIARSLAGEGGYSIAALCRSDGFPGVDGRLALQIDGTVRRGLALFRIERGGAEMAEPPPESLSAPGF